MIVVLALLGFAVTLVAGVNFRQKDRLLLQDFGTSLTAYLQLARSAALADGRRSVCLYVPDEARVFSPGLSRSLGVPDGVEVARRSPLPSRGEGEIRLMEFSMDGSSSGGEILIAYGEHTGVIAVDPLLGGVRVRW